MESRTKARNDAFVTTVLKTIILGLIVGLLIGGTLVLFVPANPEASVIVEEGSEYEGTPSNSVSYHSNTGSNLVRLLEITDFASGPMTEFWGYGDALNVQHSRTGSRISGSDFTVMYETYAHILADYESFNVTMSVSMLSGSAQVKISAAYAELDGYSFETYTLQEGQNRNLELEHSMDWIESNTEYWVMEIQIRVSIRVEEYGEIDLEKVFIDVSSNETLYPLQIQFNDQAGTDIYSNDFSNRLVYYPVANITDSSVQSQAGRRLGYIRGRANNGTVYLPAGEYSLDYGWGPIITPIFTGNLIANVSQGTATSIEIGLETTRLFIDIPSKMPIDLIVQNREIEYTITGYWDNIANEDDFFIYFPNGIETELWLKLSGTTSLYSHSLEIDFDGREDVIVHLEFPVFRVLGFGLDIPQLLLVLIIAGVAISSLISLEKLLDYRPLKEMIQHEQVFPLVLMILSFVIPWSTQTETLTDGKNVYNRYHWLNVPTGLVMHAGSDQLAVVVTMENTFTIPIQWIFGLCIFAILVRIVTGYSSDSLLNTLAPYLLPVLVALASLFYPIPSWYEVSIGPVFPLAAILVVLLNHLVGWDWLHKIRKRD